MKSRGGIFGSRRSTGRSAGGVIPRIFRGEKAVRVPVEIRGRPFGRPRENLGESGHRVAGIVREGVPDRDRQAGVRSGDEDRPCRHSREVSEPEASGVPSYASRSATKQYRAAPLRGLWQHPPYFHNGSAATLKDVVATYNAKQRLGLNGGQVNDLAEYLKSL